MTKVIAVHSFKGGTGKTTLTANLAAVLARNRRVGVMDLDLSGPGLHVLFGLKKSEIKATLPDIFLGDETPADVVIDLTERFNLKKGGLFFCPASNKVEDMLRLLKSGLEVEIFQDTIQKVGQELSQLFRSLFLQAFEFQLDVINNLSRSVFVIDNPDSGFAKKIGEAVETLERELSGATKIAN